jgi:hypothetical protein
MKNILILEKSGDELLNSGYSECTRSKYDEYKKDSAKYYTAVSDEGRYYYKEKKAEKSEEQKKKEAEEKKRKEEEKKKKREELKKKYDPTGLNQEDGDKFREWMNEKHFNFKDENGETLSKSGDPENGTIRQAWKQFKDEYQKKSDNDKNEDDDQNIDINTNDNDDDEKKPSQNVFDIPCDEWDESVNWFYTEFPDISDDERNKKSKSFYNWLQKKYGTFFLNFESSVEQNCGTDLTSPKSPFLQHWAIRRYSLDPKKTNFEAWSGKVLSESRKTWLRLIESLDPNFTPSYKDYSRYAWVGEVIRDSENVITPSYVVEEVNELLADAETLNLKNQIEMGDEGPSVFQDFKIFFEEYIDCAEKEYDMYFGNPNKKEKIADIYQNVSKFWYGYLKVMVFLKRRVIESFNFLRQKNRNKFDKYLNTLEERMRMLPNPWKVILQGKSINPDDDPNVSKQTEFLDDTNTLRKEIESAEKYVVKKQNNVVKEEINIIRKKLIEMKINKNITSSLRNKLTSKKERVNKLVESMEILYMDLYLGKTNRFFSRMMSLYETSKKSKKLIGEDIEAPTSDFETAFKRVYSGAEEDVKQSAIPYFIEKLGVDGEIKYCLENELNKIPPLEIQKIFTNTEEMAEKIVACVVSSTNAPQGKPMNAMNAIENVMIDTIGSSGDVQNKLKKQFIEIIKPIQDESSLKVREKADQVVAAIIQSLSSKP